MHHPSRVLVSMSIKGTKKEKSITKFYLVNVRIMIWIVNDLLNNRDYLPILEYVHLYEWGKIQRSKFGSVCERVE